VSEGFILHPDLIYTETKRINSSLFIFLISNVVISITAYCKVARSIEHLVDSLYL